MATNLHYTEVVEMRVGESGRPLSYQFLQRNEEQVRATVGHACRVVFWYQDAAPHVSREAEVDGVNGVAKYITRGDELTAAGDLYLRYETMAPDWYGGNAPGRYFMRTTSPIIRIRVLEAP